MMDDRLGYRLLSELFGLLPPAGATWPESRRRAWLAAAEATFKLVYATPPAAAVSAPEPRDSPDPGEGPAGER